MPGTSLIIGALLVLTALSVAFSFGSARLGCPILAIFSRWVRWILISIGMATVMYYFEWSTRPYWALAAFSFLLWFLLETLYNWLAIDALSRSSIPLFPDFRSNPRGNEWPASPRFIRLRESLRRMGLSNLTSLVAEMDGEMVMRSPIYENKDRTIRVQVLFLPHHAGAVQVSFFISSHTVSGKRLITDNFFLPYGGFYPEHFLVERRPWMRSLERILKRHEQRIAELGEELIPWDTEPEADLNHQQTELERVNLRLGFLLPTEQRADFGKISREGRYRVWKELWLLSYLGISRRY